jgi:tRNA A37 methylthiotransferase MiaB
MKKSVLFAELNVNRNVLPLASGYLRTYACLNEEIRRTYTFSAFNESARVSRDLLLKQLLSHEADVYAFSCYVWNMKLVRYLVNALRASRPHARIIMGGPQVDGHGAQYIMPDWDNVFVCNGEGERVFRDFLLAASNYVDMTSVRGLTFYRDQQLIQTEPAIPIEDINDIPSPFLAGIYNDIYSTAVWETNRGCPYACTFCYWGKGDDLSVRKFEDERLRAELEWLASKSVCHMHLGDANWGMFKRDVELSREIVRCKEKFGAPLIVTFSAAKAKIERSSEIAAVFHDAGIVSAQAIGIQSTTDAVLESIRRRNIELPVLMRSSVEMERRGVSTYAELIWPLPGETFASFKLSITSLCSSEVSSIIIYPALLLHATPMEHQVSEYAIQTVDTEDDVSELQVIISTRDVTPEEAIDGIWLSFAVYCLYNARTLWYLGRYLNNNGIMPWAELFWGFARFCRSGGSAAAEHWRNAIARRAHAEQHTMGELIHLILHDQRHEYLSVLAEFARTQEWWNCQEARALFELDLINCPYVYSNTDFTPAPESLLPLTYMKVSTTGGRRAQVVVDPQFVNLISHYVLGEGEVGSGHFDVDYQHKQFPFMPGKALRENFTYVYGMILRASVIRPRWTNLTVK